MADFNYLQNNFTSGELSPKTWRRSDIDRYKNGLRTCQNMLVLPQGGAYSRPGTGMIADIPDHTSDVRLIAFRANEANAYVLEFTNLKLRFYKNEQIVTSSTKTITGITQANPAVVTSVAHGLSNGQEVIITGVVGMTEINQPYLSYKVANVAADTFELQDTDGTNVNSTSFTAYTSGGSAAVIYSVTTPYTEAQLFDIDYVQSVDKMFIVHESHAPRELVRAGDASWTLTALMKDTASPAATLAFTDGPYLTANVTATTLTPSGTSGSVNVTASAITGINNGTGFQDTDIGRLIRWYDGTNHKYLEITAKTSTTVVVATVMSATALGGTTATTQWSLGAWSLTTGFPSHITFYQLRSCYANTTAQPDTIWLSVSDDFYNFEPGTSDDDAITVTMATMEANSIKWLASHKEIRVGTIGTEHLMRSGSSNSTLTPTSVEQVQEGNNGSGNVRPLQNATATIFVQGSGKKVRQFAYDFNIDAYVGVDLTLLNPEISGDGIIQMAYQKEPFETIWCVRDDGYLLALTYMPSQNVNAWTTHYMSGTVKSVAVIPSTAHGQDVVYVAVERSIDGHTRTYIEAIDTEFRNVDIEDAVFSDSAIVIPETAPAATLTPSATTGTYILFTANAGVFTAADEGKTITINGGTAEIVAYSTSTEVYCDITDTLTSVTAATSGNWLISKTAITGLQHLEGETVAILADGAVHTQEVVTDGTITLDSQSTYVTVGLPYDQILESLDLDFGSSKGSSIPVRSILHKVNMEFYETVGGRIGYDSTTTSPILFRDGSQPLGIRTDLYSGSINMRWPTGWKEHSKWYFINSDPTPVTILGMAFTGTVSDAN